jgi:Uma2 family endonuclease
MLEQQQTQTKQKTTLSAFHEFIERPENQDKLFELINGEIVQKVVTQKHGKIALRIGARLIDFVDEHELGHAGVEVSYNAPGDEENERLPDVSVHLTDQPPVAKGAVQGMPDLAVEVKSPSNTYMSLREKASYYLRNGSKMVWLVYPDSQQVEVYRAGQDIEFLKQGDAITGGDVLTGFTLPLERIFR